jgi:hypothetical protein
MTKRVRLAWMVLAVSLVACALVCLVAWGVLLTGFCSEVRVSVPQTRHVIPYSCHGMTVYISPLQQALRDWLIPVGMLFMLLAMAAGFMVVLSHAKVSVDVRIERKN